MNWVLFGATGAALAKDPQAGERMLSVLIYMVCFFLPVTPLLFVGSKKRVYEAVKSLVWAKVAMVMTVVFGIAGLMLVGIMLPLVQTPQPTFVIANVALVIGLLIMRFAEKTYWAAKHGSQDMGLNITAGRDLDCRKPNPGESVGEEKL